MNYLHLLKLAVNFATKRDVLLQRNLAHDVPNVVLRHDYDDLRNWQHLLYAEQKQGVTSSNYLLMNKYSLPTKEFRQYEQNDFEFGLHMNFMESHNISQEINCFIKTGLQITTMVPHGWADSNREYPAYGNWEADRDSEDPSVCSMTQFYDFCHDTFGKYDRTYEVARYYSPSGKTFFDLPYRGVMLLDDSGGWRKPYTEETVMNHMEKGKVYVFLIHPANLNPNLQFMNYAPKWLSQMEWLKHDS